MKKNELVPKKRKLNKRLLIAGLSGVMLLTPIVSSATSSISELEQEIQENQANMDAVEGEISQLEQAKEELEGYMDDLNLQIWDISEELVSLNDSIAKKETQIEKNNVKLADAKLVEAEQFESMKLRIRYMYEMGEESYAQLLVTAGSFSEFLNKAEYVNELAEYDRDMLNEYKATRKKIAKTKKKLETQKEELLTLQEQTKQKQADLEAKLASAEETQAEYAAQISEAEQIAQAYEDEINAQKNSLEALKEEEARRQAEAAARANNTYEDEYVEYEGEANDEVLLATIIYCEAGNQSYEGKVAVGSVVMNRVHSSRFPNSVSAVIYQSGQFTPVASGRFALALSSGVPQSCYDAARQVLNGETNGNWLFFRTINGIVQGDYIGDHVFY